MEFYQVDEELVSRDPLILSTNFQIVATECLKVNNRQQIGAAQVIQVYRQFRFYRPEEKL